MIDCDRGNETLVTQIGIEGVDLLGEEHAFVDKALGRERRDVQLSDILRERTLFDAAAANIEIAIDDLARTALRIVKQHLLDLRTRRVRLFADLVDVDRHLAPTIEGKSGADDFALDDNARTLLRAEIETRQKDLADEDWAVFRCVTCAVDGFAQKVLRRFNENACAVAGLAVSIDGAAMPDRLQCGDGQRNNFAARLAVNGDDEAYAARVALGVGAVEAVTLKPSAFALIARDLFSAVHCAATFACA